MNITHLYWFVIVVLLLLVLLYFLIEVNYFLRIFAAVFIAKCFRRGVDIFEEGVVYGMCLPSDIDTLVSHMNNARYMRELDFARADFYMRTGLRKEVFKQRGQGIVQLAATIRYRKYIRPFKLFRVTTKVIYWDDRTIFMEHRFVTVHDNFVRAIAICRQRLLGCSAHNVLQALLDDNSRTKIKDKSIPFKSQNLQDLKPPIPAEVDLWLRSNEISSRKLRAGGDSQAEGMSA